MKINEVKRSLKRGLNSIQASVDQAAAVCSAIPRSHNHRDGSREVGSLLRPSSNLIHMTHFL